MASPIDKILFADQHLALCHGNYYEPRILYATAALATSGAGRNATFPPSAFYNGEVFPLHLTHLVMAIRDHGAAGTDETLAQRIGLRLTEYSAYYMIDDFVPMPNWQNVPNGLGDPYGSSMSVWNWTRPVLLPFSSSLFVNVYLENALQSGTRRVAVSFHGQRAVSRQAVELSGYTDTDVTDQGVRITPAVNYANDGSEEIVVEGMTVNVLGPSTDLTNVGDIREARIRVGLEGAGTQSDFTKTTQPSPASSDRGCPAVLLGVSGGRCITHRIPRGGWILHPGHGFQVEARYLQPVSACEVVFGAVGYVVVPG